MEVKDAQKKIFFKKMLVKVNILTAKQRFIKSNPSKEVDAILFKCYLFLVSLI